jgi:hypothetical protein
MNWARVIHGLCKQIAWQSFFRDLDYSLKDRSSAVNAYLSRALHKALDDYFKALQEAEIGGRDQP